jgi:hypothetical protein
VCPVASWRQATRSTLSSAEREFYDVGIKLNFVFYDYFFLDIYRHIVTFSPAWHNVACLSPALLEISIQFPTAGHQLH